MTKTSTAPTYNLTGHIETAAGRAYPVAAARITEAEIATYKQAIGAYVLKPGDTVTWSVTSN